MKTIEFTVDGTNTFGWFTANRKCRIDSTFNNEDIFRSCWNSLPKRLERGWETISFVNEGENITVCRHWLKETGFNFDQSHETETV